MLNKKALSGILTTLILIALALVLIGILWYAIKPMIERNIEHASACSPTIIGKINLNKLNTCYQDDKDNNAPNSAIKVGIETADIDYDKIIVFVSKAGATKNFEVTMNQQGKNSGQTYTKILVDDLGFDNDAIPSTVKLIPVIDGEQCDVIDSINEVATCP